MQLRFINTIIVFVILSFVSLFAAASVEAYAPIIKGRVCEDNTGPAENCKAIPNVFVSWTSSMPAGTTSEGCSTAPATRYTKTDAQGYYLFPSWGGTSSLFNPVFKDGAQYDSQIQRSWSSCGPNCLPGIDNGAQSPEFARTLDHDGDPATPPVKQAGSSCANQYSCKAGSSHVFTAVKTPTMVGEFTSVQATGRAKDDEGLEPGAGIILANHTDYIINIFFKPVKTTKTSSISPPPKAGIITGDKDIACLPALPCGGKDTNGVDVQCSSATEAESEEVKRARIKLSGLANVVKETPTADKPVYIIQCNKVSGTYDCSTGNADIDKELGLKNSGSVQVKGIFAQDGTTSIGAPKFTAKLDDTYEWETTVPTSGKTAYSFYIVANGQKVQQNGSVGGQQLGTVTFAGCTEIEDPKGTVFDSYTLEPLSNVQVSLQKKRANSNFTQVAANEVPAGFQNPITTQLDGQFSFFVPDGTYKLQANLQGFTFPYNFTKLNKNFSQFYKNLYKGQELVQKGEIIHTDIPLDPVDKKASEEYAKNNPAKVVTYTQSIDKDTNTLFINGTVSHPLSQLALYSKKPAQNGKEFERGRLLKQLHADQEGKFSFKISLDSLTKEEVVGELDAKKHKGFVFDNSRLNAKGTTIDSISNWFSNLFVVHAYQTTSTIQIDPLLNYIEGYAKDEQGKIVANATVQVTVPMLNTPVFETKADAQGYFKIYSDNLPTVEYSLAYLSPQKGQILLSNNTFLVQNTDLLQKGTVDFYAYTPSNPSAQRNIAKRPTTSASTGEVAGTSDSRPMASYISFILVLLIGAVGSMLFMHVNHKKSRRRS